VDEVFTIGMNRALDLIAAKATRGGRVAAAPLRELGEHPSGGKIAVMAGRYGPYVKWEKVNATLPKGMEPEDVTLEQALELIAAKAGTKGRKKAAPRAKTAAKAKSPGKPRLPPRPPQGPKRRRRPRPGARPRAEAALPPAPRSGLKIRLIFRRQRSDFNSLTSLLKLSSPALPVAPALAPPRTNSPGFLDFAASPRQNGVGNLRGSACKRSTARQPRPWTGFSSTE
jgi:hypothetical protein